MYGLSYRRFSILHRVKTIGCHRCHNNGKNRKFSCRVSIPLIFSLVIILITQSIVPFSTGFSKSLPAVGIDTLIPFNVPFESKDSRSPDIFRMPAYGQETGEDQYIVLLNRNDSFLSSTVNNDNQVRLMAEESKSRGAEVIRTYNSLNGYVIRIPEYSRTSILEDLRSDPRVAEVEVDQRVYAFNHMQSLPTGVDRIDGELSYTKAGDGTGSVQVDVAVLDTGIDLTHPDLNVYKSTTFVTGTSSAKDDNGHGTLVAGIIGAKDNHVGVVGVAPDARLWAVKVLDKTGSGLISDIIAGIDYVVEHSNEIDVANLSFGCQCTSNALDSAINRAVGSGITFATAAGNSNKNANSFSPANNPNVMAVSAIVDTDGKCGAKGPSSTFGSDDTLASFSNYGSVIDVAAPGVGILSTSMNGGYAKVSGTSAAAPHVTGAAALYIAQHPAATPNDVKLALLKNSVPPTAVCDGNGWGYFTGDKDSSKEPLLSVKQIEPVPNKPPTADPKSATTKMNTPVDITLSGKDPENRPLTFNVVDLPKNGKVTSVPGSSNIVRYTPNLGFTGSDSFTYTAKDDKGATSSKATVKILIELDATCTDLQPVALSASGSDSNVPSNAIDNNLNTRWSDNGVGSWIQLDLGSKKSICSVDIGWYRGNLRENNFVISVSDNANTFTNKFTGTSSGSTTSPEKYTLPAGTEGRYVRITVNGNTENNWASITEIAVFGSAATSGSSCTKQPPTAISASGFISPNSPSKAIDNNFNTRWANKGVGSWIQLDLGSTKNICSVDVAWYLGSVRQFKFDISISNDGASFTQVRSGTSSGTTTAFEKYTLPAGTEARFIRITVNGNDVTTYGNAAEIAVFGSASGQSPTLAASDSDAIEKFDVSYSKKLDSTKPGFHKTGQ
ncbi:MAG: S8 family serine peptidase [Nitrososphaeraceae archaeon]|nr:S8 family serine peptidase [Nitrososphaeraceae archaeon]